MKKKLVILGKGTAGAQAIAHYVRWMPSDTEIEWFYDPNIPTQSVGEGSVLPLAANMYNNLCFGFPNLKEIDGSIKTGIAKKNWGKSGKWFFHNFPPPNVAFHFNAVKLQDYIFNKVKDKVKIVEINTTSDKIDADFIMDCSGKPNNYEKFNIPNFVPVNSVHVNQCFWEGPTFDYTITYARPYGWIFGIPLQNRCSIGYLYNNTINTLDEIKVDILEAIKELGLTPSDTTNSFTFGNYTRKQNFEERIVYNGNASFFLEPLEATSVGVMDLIQRSAFDLWHKKITLDQANNKYNLHLNQIEKMIMLHYFAGSIYDTPFWTFAKTRGKECVKSLLNDQIFLKIFNNIKDLPSSNYCRAQSWSNDEWGGWWPGSLLENIDGLEIKKRISKTLNR